MSENPVSSADVLDRPGLVRVVDRDRVRTVTLDRAEALNAFNTPLFAPPITNISLKTFGQVTYQANIPRNLQLGIRLGW